jgi:NADPH:quinone reductase-like Zn-dependent oxidoreductase
VKAIVFDRFGEPDEVLQVRDLPEPTPGPGQVRVRMLASPVNPSDLLTVQGRYTTLPKLPATPGFEGVGVVEAVGGGLLGRLRQGRRVAVIADRGGTWAERVVVPARQVVPVPDDIPDEQAANFFVNPATALVMTQYLLRVPPGKGEWLLQSAAGSALGRMIIRLGERYGFHTLNVVRRPEQAEELKQFGADAIVVGSDAESIRSQVLQAAQGRSIRYAIDPVGGETGTAVVASLSEGGRALLFGSLSGRPITVDPRLLITGSKRVEGFYLGEWAKRQSVPTMLMLFRRIKRHMRAGVLTTDVAATYRLDQIAEAVRHAARPGHRGKVLLRIADGNTG